MGPIFFAGVDPWTFDSKDHRLSSPQTQSLTLSPRTETPVILQVRVCGSSLNREHCCEPRTLLFQWTKRSHLFRPLNKIDQFAGLRSGRWWLLWMPTLYIFKINRCVFVFGEGSFLEFLPTKIFRHATTTGTFWKCGPPFKTHALEDQRLLQVVYCCILSNR